MIEVIKMIIVINLEFCRLEKGFVTFVLGIPVLAWLIALFGGDCAFAATFNKALVAGILGGVLAFFVVPLFAKSSVKEVNYSMDWLFHIFFSLVGVAYWFFIAWPLLAHMSGAHNFF